MLNPVVISVIATLAGVALLGGAFYAGIRWERRRREKFDEWIYEQVQASAARLDAAIGGADEAEECRPVVN